METTTVFLFDKFLEIEDENSLFEYRIGKIKIWQYVRFSICARLLEELTGIRTTSKGSKDTRGKTPMKWLTKLKRNQFLVHHKDALFITYSRRVLENGKYRDCVAEELMENMRLNYYVFENAYMGGHCEPVQTKNLKYVDTEFLYHLFKYNESIYEKEIKKLVNLLYNIFSVKFEHKIKSDFMKFMYSYIKLRIKQIYYNTLYAKFIISIISPKVVILYGAYLTGMQEIVCIAKQKEIPVIELQHGRIGPTHGGYNYKSLHELETFPDYLFVYGEYEKENVRYPIEKDRIFSVGAPELEKKAKLYNSRNYSSDRQTVLFTPGAMENEIVIEYAIELEKRLDKQKFEIIYKLHPADYADWKIKYPQLKRCTFEIVDNNKHDIYFYLGRSDYVVGISSTSLFEAMMFRTQIIVIKSQDYMKVEAVYNNCGKLITSEDELVDIIKLKKKIRKNYNCDFYYNKNAVKNMRRVINNIIDNYK